MRNRSSRFALSERKQTSSAYQLHEETGNCECITFNYAISEDNADMKLRWSQINWTEAEEQVSRLQIRIVKATLEQKLRLVKRLQYLITNSFYAKALAVKRVVSNRGKKTPGIDGEFWKSDKEKVNAVRSLDCQTYHAKPLKRVYIEKFGKKEKRPLGIPTMRDRAMQALQLLALEPVAETTADRISFGFRKYRSPEDAREYAFSVLSRKDSPQWILEGDIKSCFDKISHRWMMDNIPGNKRIMKEFMRCGYVEKGKLYPTIEGSPQGGVISPTYANMVLDGLEPMILDVYWRSKVKRTFSVKYNAHKVHVVRFADDFIVTASDKETLKEFADVKAEVEKLLDVFKFRDAQKEAMNLARIGNKYLADTEPWKLAKTDMERVGTILNISLQLVANLAIAFDPFLPFSSERLRKMLNMDTFDWSELGRDNLLPVGHQLNKPELLFEKIEDATIEAQVQKLLDTKKANEEANYKANPIRPNIEFDDFTKLDIRVGTILECQKVPKADKLLQFKIDDGLETRTIVSGIAKHYQPEELVGKQVCFIANLAPRKLKGIVSEGMILSAENNDGSLAVIMPGREVKPGSEVK